MPRPSSSSRNLIRALRAALRAAADPAKTAPTQAYMKSAMPYLGVPMPQVREVCHKLFSHAKRDTDPDLLYECIERAMEDSELFLRKAIGWALREYAKTDADEVLRYVEQHRARLSPLSKREALKGLLRAGRIKTVP